MAHTLGEMSSRLRVLIVASPPHRIGGQEVQAAGLVSHLGSEGSVKVSFLPIAPLLPGPFALLQRVRYLRTVVQSAAFVALLMARVWRHDVVHVLSASHSSFLISATPPILVARLYRRKAVLNYHSGAVEDHLARWRRTAIPIMRLAHLIVVPSERLARAFDRHGLPARTLPNAIELSRFAFRSRETLRPVFLANRSLSRHYNVECVLRAFALIQERTAEAQLIVAGDGPERRPLERLARDLGLHGVTFLGWVPPARMGELYAAADIYLNGSDVDAAPLSILEASAAGLPVVTTDAGGIPEMVQHGSTAMVVGRGDHVAMAACAHHLLADRRLAGAIIESARRSALEHDWELVRPRWLALYRELADGRADVHSG
jgi:L-malate glycosyltransferase